MSQIVSSTVEKSGGAFNISLFQGATLVKVVVGAVIGVAVIASVATAGIVLGVRAQPSPPKAIDDVYETFKNKAITFYPTSNDIAVEKDNIVDPTQIFLDSVIPGDITGKVTYDTEAKSVTYTPAKGFIGLETFKYVVRNTKRSAEGHINVTVVNHPPQAYPDNYLDLARKVDHDLYVLLNDTDLDEGDKELLTIESHTQPESIGTVTPTADKKHFTFKPHATATGTGSFYYTITDGNDVASAKVTINLVNKPPVAVNDEFTVLMNSGANTFNILANDSDPNGDDITITRVGVAGIGNVQKDASSKTVQYVPKFNAAGSDVFDYFVTDSYVAATDEAQALVSVTVLNKPPVAQPLSISQYKSSSPQAIDLALPISDENPFTTLEVTASGSSLGVVTYSSSDATHTVTYNGEERTWTEKTWTASYTPASKTSYKEVVTYTVSDGVNTATGTINVEIKNHAPVATPMAIEVLLNSGCTEHSLGGHVTDEDGDDTKIYRITGASGGVGSISVVDAAAKKFKFCVASQYPDSKVFSYTVHDEQNQSEYNEFASSTITVTITNTPPTCGSATITMEKRKEHSYDALSLCSDTDGDPLTLLRVTGGDSGVAMSAVVQQQLMVSSKVNAGSVTFTFVVSDGRAEASGTLTVNVPNREPSANRLSQTIFRNITTSTTFSPSLIDLDGDSVSIKSLAADSSYTDGAVLDGGRTVAYDNIRFSIAQDNKIVAEVTNSATTTEHTRAVRYTVADSDSTPLTASSTVTLTVKSNAPWALGTTVTYEQGVEQKVNLVPNLAGDIDRDDLKFTVTKMNASSPINPSVGLNTGILTYPANSTYCTSDVVRFTVTTIDGQASAYITFVPTNCKCLAKPADVCFLIDKSGSVFSTVGSDWRSAPTLVKWKQQIQFARDISAAFEYGTTNTKATIVNYNEDAWVEQPLSASKSTVDAKFATLYAQTETKQTLRTFTAKGFEKCKSALGNSNRQKIYILISDGVATDDPKPIVSAIKEAGKSHIISVGIGMFDGGAAELRSYASDAQSFFQPEDFDDLENYLDLIIGNACAA